MKKLFILILILFVSNVLVQAQFIQGYGVKVGLSIANQNLNTSNQVTPTTQNFKYKTGLDIGAYIEMFDLSLISILPELHYVQKGREVKGIYDEGSIDYLSIPIHAKFFVEKMLVTPYLILGPRIDILVSNNYEYIVPFSIAGGEIYEDVVFGVNVGLGIETEVIEPITLLIEFRYSPDFTYATKSPYKYKNRSFGILVGVGL